MTKDWESVRAHIKELSVDQKKNLEDVKAAMETKHRFRASTRAYRMKLKEWGYLRHRPRKAIRSRNAGREKDNSAEPDEDSSDESDESSPTAEGNVTLLEEVQDLITSIDPWSQAGTMTTHILMNMLAAVLEGDSQKLEQLIIANPNHINYPVGLPFDAHGGRFFNHPAMQQCIILQHPEQTLLDIACALPSGPVLWVLAFHGSKGSTHPLGTDLALQNAIKNARNVTVQGLLHSGISNVHGPPGTSWRPLLQAVFWNVPEIVRVLLDRGARVNDTSPPLDEMPFQTALQLVLNRRAKDYLDQGVKERSEKILKMLLDAGADIHLAPTEDSFGLTPFETFLKPWQSDAAWVGKMSPTAGECLEAFVRKGANLQVLFAGFPCSAPIGNTFEHQVLWHSTPSMARLIVDHACPAPAPQANGSNILDEILGSCPHAKRHPADTLRDIEVLIKRGANPNHPGSHGSTPLTTCIEACPGVDIVARLNALLEGGADPELRDANGIRPVVLAARAFDEPLLPQVMDLLVSKFRGRHSNLDQSVWSEGFFPISKDPTFAQVLWYTGQNGEFEENMRRMLPENVLTTFRNACFSVVSKNFLDAVTERAKMTGEVRFTVSETDEIQHVNTLRQARFLPEYRFYQDFVMSLIMSSARLPAMPTHDIVMTSAPEENSRFYDIVSSPTNRMSLNAPTSLGPNLPTPLPMDTPQATSTPERRASISSTSSNDSTSSFFINTTTQIRWPAIGRATRPDDVEKAKGKTLMYLCKSCSNGLKLTEDEYQRHEEEHVHTLTCCEIGCKRRFCVAERG